MSTTETVPVSTSTDVENSSAGITTELVVYRTYGAFDDKGLAVGVKGKDKDGNILYAEKPSVQSQSANGDNWKAAEAKGATVLAENSMRFYKLNSLEGFHDLVPDAEQQVYIIQKGLDAIQTSAANKLQTELAEKSGKDDPDVFANNGETIDLREYINTPPQRRNLTDEQKFMKAVGVLAPEKLLQMMEALKQQLDAQTK